MINGQRRVFVTALAVTASVFGLSFHLEIKSISAEAASFFQSYSQTPSTRVIEEAKQAFEKLRSTESFDDLPECFTNRTAAKNGLAWAAALRELASISESVLSDRTTSDNLNDDLNSLLGRYRLSLESIGDQDRLRAAQDQLEIAGRGFLRAIMASGRRPSPKKATEPARLSIFKQVISIDVPLLDECEFRALSATVVRVTRRDGSSMEQLESRESLELRFEDGRWRIDTGGIEEFRDPSKILPTKR